MSKDVLIGKVLSSVFFVLGVILLVASFTILYFYDAEENSVKTLTDGIIEVEKGMKDIEYILNRVVMI